MKNWVYGLGVIVSMAGCGDGDANYHLKSIGDQTIVLDGRNDDEAWDNIKTIRNFRNPWNDEVNPPTALQLCQDRQMLYFYFEVVDPEVVLEEQFTVERDVEKEDRVELFFSRDDQMGDYYCFEIDAESRVLAYRARNYRQMDYDWDVPTGFEVKSIRTDDGYSVEGKIPLTFLTSLTSGNEISFGAYRAEFSRSENGLVENWLTWINPKTPEADFHVPASLGKLRLTR